MEKETIEFVKKCDKCQRTPTIELSLVLNPIPFVWWGIDLMGKFLTTAVRKEYLIVAVDYFTKWIEAAPGKHHRLPGEEVCMKQQHYLLRSLHDGCN